MKTALLGFGLAALVLACPNHCWAGYYTYHHTPSGRGVGATNYHQMHGTPFSGGHYYRGPNHNHWTASYYSPAHRATFRYCPSTRAWYSWNQSANGYYPSPSLRTLPQTPNGINQPLPGGFVPPGSSVPPSGYVPPPPPPDLTGYP